MPDLSNVIEVARPVTEFPDSLLNQLLIAEIGGGTSDRWLAFVHEHTQRDSLRGTGEAAIEHEEQNICELIPRLPTLTAGPWRSIGGCLDYSRWADRDRFIELDKTIGTAPYHRGVAA